MSRIGLALVVAALAIGCGSSATTAAPVPSSPPLAPVPRTPGPVVPTPPIPMAPTPVPPPSTAASPTGTGGPSGIADPMDGLDDFAGAGAPVRPPPPGHADPRPETERAQEPPRDDPREP